jgi:dienelactone hydrolase
MPTYMALPNGTVKVPGVIILHERYGFVQHPHDVAKRFAHILLDISADCVTEP